jgi:hypothetical protein
MRRSTMGSPIRPTPMNPMVGIEQSHPLSWH